MIDEQQGRCNTWRGGGGAEGGGGDGVVVQEQLLDAEAEPPEEVLAAVRRRRLLPAAERGEEDALLAPGGGVLEAREQGPELGVGGVAGGRAPLEEGLHGGLGILLHAHAAHGWMDGDQERERAARQQRQRPWLERACLHGMDLYMWLLSSSHQPIHGGCDFYYWIFIYTHGFK